MYISPESGMTWEQTLENVWRESSPERQAVYQQVMAAAGKTWDQLCREAREGFLERFAEAPFARSLLASTHPDKTKRDVQWLHCCVNY
jgi:hypothetical protein